MASLAHKRAVIIHPPDNDGRLLLRHLRRTGMTAELMWPAPMHFPADTQFAVVLVDRDQPGVSAKLFDEFAGVSIAILDAESPTILETLLASNVQGILTKPIRNFGILAQLTLAASRHGYLHRLADRIAHVESNLRARRIIEKATTVLMERQGIDSDAAYETLRREAMKRRTTVGSMAAALLVDEKCRDEGFSD